MAAVVHPGCVVVVVVVVVVVGSAVLWSMKHCFRADRTCAITTRELGLNRRATCQSHSTDLPS